ncbi:MAG: hypothetical protein KC609_26900 [Myxococcales bacterium]|nr:hypothetical protein [Myxococcales bacterium]
MGFLAISCQLTALLLGLLGCGPRSSASDVETPGDTTSETLTIPSAPTIAIECADDDSFTTPRTEVRVGDTIVCRIVLLAIPAWAASYHTSPSVYRWESVSDDGGGVDSSSLDEAGWREIPSYVDLSLGDRCRSQGATPRALLQDCQSVCCRSGQTPAVRARARCAEEGGTVVDPLWQCDELPEGQCHVFDGVGRTPLYLSTTYCEWGHCGTGSQTTIEREDLCLASGRPFTLERDGVRRVCCRDDADGSYVVLAVESLVFVESLVELRATAPGTVTLRLVQASDNPVPFVEASPGSSALTLTITP